MLDRIGRSINDRYTAAGRVDLVGHGIYSYSRRENINRCGDVVGRAVEHGDVLIAVVSHIDLVRERIHRDEAGIVPDRDVVGLPCAGVNHG